MGNQPTGVIGNASATNLPKASCILRYLSFRLERIAQSTCSQGVFLMVSVFSNAAVTSSIAIGQVHSILHKTMKL